MKSSVHTKSILLISTLIAVLALSSLACTVSGIPFSSKTATLDVTLHQDDLDSLFQRANVNSDSHDPLLKEITGIEIHEGYVRVSGIAETPQGDEVDGSYDASMSAADGALQVQIIAVNIAGVEMDDPRVIEANQQLAKDLSDSVQKSNGEVRFEEVTLSEGALNIKIRLSLQND